MGNSVSTALSWLEGDLQLDVVGLLAVIGESAMSTHAQIATASRWSLLPRLIPAPQALLRHTRPHRLPPVPSVKVVGVKSGNFQTELNYFPNLIHCIENVTGYSFEQVRISHSDREEQLTGQTIPARRMGPLVMLSIFGMMCSAGLLGLAINQGDGMAILAICLLSVTSTLVGLGSRWYPVIPQRNETRVVPKADVMIIGRQGAFIHVQCTEPIARGLYFGQESCKYDISERWFHVISGTGTFMLMASVIAMANCKFILQAGMGLAYIVLNGLYWIAALVPGDWHWELGVYDIQSMQNSKKKHEKYSDALIDAIGAARGTSWVAVASAAPKTEAWTDWLSEAEKVFVANEDKSDEDVLKAWKDWQPREKLTQCLKYGTLERATTAQLAEAARKGE